MNSEVHCIICGRPSRIFYWDDKMSVASCIEHIREFYDGSFSYPYQFGGQALGGGLADLAFLEQSYSEAEMGVLSYLLSFWSSLPDLPDR